MLGQSVPKKYLLFIQRIALFQFVENTDLDFASIPVFGNGSYNLDGHAPTSMGVSGLYYLAERALSQ